MTEWPSIVATIRFVLNIRIVKYSNKFWISINTYVFRTWKLNCCWIASCNTHNEKLIVQIATATAKLLILFHIFFCFLFLFEKIKISKTIALDWSELFAYHVWKLFDFLKLFEKIFHSNFILLSEFFCFAWNLNRFVRDIWAEFEPRPHIK